MKNNFHVPIGKYKITNMCSHMEQVNIYSDQCRLVNGFEEACDCKCYLLKVGESITVNIPEGYHITLIDSTIKLEDGTIELVDGDSVAEREAEALKAASKILNEFSAVFVAGVKTFSEYPNKKVIQKALFGKSKKIKERNRKKILNEIKRGKKK